MADDCIFCDLSPESVVASNSLAVAFRDRYPVTEGHTLVVPRRHVTDFFDMTTAEVSAVLQLAGDQRLQLQADDRTIQGFNIGVNIGQASGQTISHCHLHLIPRRSGDVEDPRGGIRHVIPGKGYYP